MKRYLTADDIANNVRMMRTQFRGSVLIIEGSTDMRLYQRFVDDKRCKVIPANGKENAIKVIQILKRSKMEGVLTIVDADFWRVDGIRNKNDNVLVTDTHDLETMLIASEALDRLLEEFTSQYKVEALHMPIRQLLLYTAMPLGLFRWLSSSGKDKLSLRFKDIDFDHFMEVQPLSINIKRLIREVKVNSHGHSLNERAIRKKLMKMLGEDHDPWQICSGHDVVEILAFGLREIFGNLDAHHTNEGIIDRSLRLAYDITMFKKTDLYSSILNWEEENVPYIVLSEA
ncbi:MAG: DUF4435 domain-containing protein [Methanococcoides sp.]|nr:DUF4435 domain-containing protein [Methanococcoides sp.]